MEYLERKTWKMVVWNKRQTNGSAEVGQATRTMGLNPAMLELYSKEQPKNNLSAVYLRSPVLGATTFLKRPSPSKILYQTPTLFMTSI